MFAQQMNDFQARINETSGAAQKRAQTRAKELEAEARKIFETLGGRAQAELRVLLAQAQGMSKEQVAQLGGELVKLGSRLQELAKAWTVEPKAAADAEAAPVEPPAN